MQERTDEEHKVVEQQNSHVEIVSPKREQEKRVTMEQTEIQTMGVTIAVRQRQTEAVGTCQEPRSMISTHEEMR